MMKVFDPDAFYADVNAGKEVQSAEILEYIRSFDRIVIWGAGNLGSAVGKKLLQFGIDVTEYWDQRHADLRECNGIPVREPFRAGFPGEGALIVHCIVNGSRGDRWPVIYSKTKGYQHTLRGMEFFAGFVCPLHENTRFDISVCTGLAACSLCNCQKYTNLRLNGIGQKAGSLVFQLMTFIITTRCSLRCKFCGQRLHDYPPEKILNYPLDSIKKDIDVFLRSTDFTGMISVIGGEPFLHRDIAEIVGHILRHDNFGVVNITTNGVCRIDPETLKRILHPQVKISFSLYSKFLDRQQNEIIDKNIDMVRRSGIACSVGNPLWTAPHPIALQGFSREQMIRFKAACACRRLCASIRNGVFLPCSTVETATGIGLLDLQDDCIRVHDGDFRKKLSENLNKEYYQACMYCNHSLPEEIPAGQQL